jgi:hypothetical protein
MPVPPLPLTPAVGNWGAAPAPAPAPVPALATGFIPGLGGMTKLPKDAAESWVRKFRDMKKEKKGEKKKDEEFAEEWEDEQIRQDAIREVVPETVAAAPPRIVEQKQWAEDIYEQPLVHEQPIAPAPPVTQQIGPQPQIGATNGSIEEFGNGDGFYEDLRGALPRTMSGYNGRTPRGSRGRVHDFGGEYGSVFGSGSINGDEDFIDEGREERARQEASAAKAARDAQAAQAAKDAAAKAARDAQAAKDAAAQAAKDAQTTEPPPAPVVDRTGRGSGFSGEQRWFDPNAPAPAERDIGGFSPHELPRTSADFAAAGDVGGADLLSRLNAPAAPVQDYLAPAPVPVPAPVPGAAEGGLIDQIPTETIQKLVRAAQQIESPGSQQIIEQAIEEYGLDAVKNIITMIQQQGPMTAPDGAVPGSGMDRGGLINGGGGDAMADDILVNAEMAMNGERQPIAVSAGEYIVPGDVLAHLGSGNTEEGGEVMDQFIEDVRVQRTGSPEQPPPIDLRDVLPGTYGERYG